MPHKVATILIPASAHFLPAADDWALLRQQLYNRPDDPLIPDNSPTQYPCYAHIDHLWPGSGRHLYARFQFYYIHLPQQP